MLKNNKMALEIRKSLINPLKESISNKLWEDIKSIFDEKWLNWLLYLWYPLVNNWNDLFQLDALLISENYWVVVFSLVEDNISEDMILSEDKKQNSILRLLHQKFVSEEELYDLEKWLVTKLKAVTYSTPSNKNYFDNFIEKRRILSDKKIISFALDKKELISEIFKKEDIISKIEYSKIISLVQDVIKLKTSRQRVVKNDNSKWYKLNEIEKTISTLDARQEEAVISFFDWIQRIRWLAGSWKTVVLALKVAFYHSLRPEAKIAITFHSRSLKQQFKKLIERFCISKTWIEPDWNKIKIIHAWWGTKEEGIYYNFCVKYWFRFLNYWTAKLDKYQNWVNWKTEFDHACNSLLNDIPNDKSINWEYDIIFIDEAQDLSTSFLKLCYKILIPTNEWNKRLIYAYDELQKLDEWTSLPEPVEIFWVDIKDISKQDLILYKCYRNSKQVLTTAHSIWFWIYREWWPVQFFDKPNLWNEIWYKHDNELIWGNEITLYRDLSSSPDYFDKFFKEDDFIQFNKFETIEKQWEWVANQIVLDIKEQELVPNDILIIYPTSFYKSKILLWVISNILFENNIKIYNAWEDSPDIFFKDTSVTMTWIYRAKWNEVWMVYIVNADECYKWSINDNFELKKLRNMLFTAITRSKAWVRVTWTWNNMDLLINEFNKVKDNNYKLKFKYPTKDEIDKMNKIYWDLSSVDKKRIKKNTVDIQNILKIIIDIKEWVDIIENYPEEFQDIIKKLINNE